MRELGKFEEQLLSSTHFFSLYHTISVRTGLVKDILFYTNGDDDSKNCCYLPSDLTLLEMFKENGKPKGSADIPKIAIYYDFSPMETSPLLSHMIVS